MQHKDLYEILVCQLYYKYNVQNKIFRFLILFACENIQHFNFLSVLYCISIYNLKYATTAANVVIIFLMFNIFLMQLLDNRCIVFNNRYGIMLPICKPDRSLLYPLISK
jgi:hypothetical protein